MSDLALTKVAVRLAQTPLLRLTNVACTGCSSEKMLVGELSAVVEEKIIGRKRASATSDPAHERGHE